MEESYHLLQDTAKYTPDISREDVEMSLSLALKMWSDAAPLKFVNVNRGKADIVFSFAHRAHGDFSPFDGPGEVLAHAFQPREGLGGDVHHDEDETWTTAGQGRKYWVVQQLKTRSTAGDISEFKLPSTVRQVDAAVHVAEYGKTFFFVGQFYYRYDERKRQMDSSFTRSIQTDCRGIPSLANAAFKLHGSIFFLSGTKSYQYDFRQKQVVNIIAGNSWLGG